MIGVDYLREGLYTILFKLEFIWEGKGIFKYLIDNSLFIISGKLGMFWVKMFGYFISKKTGSSGRSEG